jgi:tripartite-type tricarboxylate transporter receptor subunit TctC
MHDGTHVDIGMMSSDNIIIRLWWRRLSSGRGSRTHTYQSTIARLENVRPKDDAMKFSRRQFLLAAGGAAALPSLSRFARAQTYPTRPVRIIVPFPPGGSSEIAVRLIGQWLSERLGQPFLIENRPGAGGNIGTEAAARAAPDGYTLLWATSPNAINATVYDKLNFNFIRDIAAVAGVMRVPNVMAVNPSVPAKTIPDFIAYAKANPGRINFASAGNGSTSHVAGELFKMITGVDMVHVPYRGGAPALTDLIGGQVQVMFVPTALSTAQVKAGKLRALAVTATARLEAMPDLPTVAEFVMGFEASLWLALGAPKNTPTEIVNRLNKEINSALADPKIRARLAEMDGTALALSPAECDKLIADETEKWGKVVKFAGIKPE